MAKKTGVDPKTIIWFPLWTFVLLAVASIFFDIPMFVVFLVLSLVLIYFAVIAVIELFNK
ncbi:hypothetical protein [Atopococcus tabaci]|uniref:hypothetical protein n=1 Tax=Atopococcus tabaci TaxID=269774 RepID=UPI00040E2AD9|nr:hypothetical protein [Atopococcus tabaci]